MSDIMNIIRERRSVRKYADKQVPEDIVNEILEAVRWSQSWANTQCWELVVIKDRTVKEELHGTVPRGNPSAEAIVSAPVLIALCAKLESSGYYKGTAPTKFGDWFMFDLGIAAQSMALAAHSLGLGKQHRNVVHSFRLHDKSLCHAESLPHSPYFVTV